MKMISVLLLLCLSAICNAELRTWTAVNGKEVEAEFVSNEKGVVKLKLKSGKVFEVPANKLSKEDNEFISYLAKPEGVNAYELRGRGEEGLLYIRDSETPYTGKAFSMYESGQKESESNFKDGKPDGFWMSWHENGQKKSESNHKDGQLVEGSEKFWNNKGEPVDSRIETITKPVEEKVLEVKEEVKSEELVAETKPKLEGVNAEELEEREGIMYMKGSDTPYTGKFFLLHENRQKRGEGNFKNGKIDGLCVAWYKNGQKAIEGNHKDGKKIGLEVAWYENGQKEREWIWKDGNIVEGSDKYWNSKGEPVDSGGKKLKPNNP